MSFQKDFNETKINEWTHRSQKEGICGILNCYNKPSIKCKRCANYYCQEHLESHIDLIPDGEPVNQSGKSGLDYHT